MASQQAILEILATIRDPVKVDELAAALERRVRKPARKGIFVAIGRLMQRGLIDAKHGRPLPTLYEISAKGRAFLKDGKRVVSGARGKHNAPHKIGPDEFRARVWAAFRLLKKASLPDMVEIARRKNEDAVKAHDNARKYLKALCRAGIAAQLPTRVPGHAPSSNGFKRYALVKDLGPQAPSARAKGVQDFNSGTLIPYAEPAP